MVICVGHTVWATEGRKGKQCQRAQCWPERTASRNPFFEYTAVSELVFVPRLQCSRRCWCGCWTWGMVSWGRCSTETVCCAGEQQLVQSIAGHCRGQQCRQTLEQERTPGTWAIGPRTPSHLFYPRRVFKSKLMVKSFQKLPCPPHSVYQMWLGLWERGTVLHGVRGWELHCLSVPHLQLHCLPLSHTPWLPPSSHPPSFVSPPFIHNPLNCLLV